MLIPPREPCPQCRGGGSTTYHGHLIGKCWGCSGLGHTRDWHHLHLAALELGAVIAASAAAATALAWLRGDLTALLTTVTTFIEVTP
ncbi:MULTISPECIES: hypothetical protein [Nonomuraea]|uniref:Uncharacterized protein n=1 Tax=Nonomuraea africana TaxID=46171 RepID=A0ABR9KY94_9ACTN|nr:hypothetical protein [Nonomuraea africana]MBE1566578.1 hypothetical protein [Nonomuraea africana]